MKSYKYLIVGGGMTADSALKGIREVDPNGSVALISSEAHPPYDRPPLSKALWQGKREDTIWRGSTEAYADLILGRTVRQLSADQKHLTDDRGETYSYEELLLATGCEPRRFPFGGDDIIYFRTVDDYRRLRGLASCGKSFAIIGGGFIGSEIAAALALNGKTATIIFPESSICARGFPSDLGKFVNRYYEDHGVRVMAGQTVAAVRREKDGLVVTTGQGAELIVDGIVAGIGVVPRIELAQSAGLQVENGIVVDHFLRTRNPEIYAAGDVASFYNPLLDRRIRVEHEDNANTMGHAAGRIMAGEAEPYRHLPFFYSDLFDLGYEAIGEVDSRLETYCDWKEQYRKGVVYYLRDSRVTGVLLWNVWEQVDAARTLIAGRREIRPTELSGKIAA